ncbi:uncharacterized protein G2W53_036093 [Senna tora]|uniref:Uncharacterized protein n=1 Tax=Senna tora TaxID=362788 RepID=A0A834SS35_9FABA|nr:uncharacterized protein G2W53_036093 [Senna tora]
MVVVWWFTIWKDGGLGIGPVVMKKKDESDGKARRRRWMVVWAHRWCSRRWLVEAWCRRL